MSNDAMQMVTLATPEQAAVLAAEVRKTLDATQRVHLDQLECRIREQRERYTLSMLAIGELLNEAKEAHLVDHGHWQDWVAMHTGLTVRSAQRVMRAAREIPKTSTLSLLDFSKVSALLAVPAEEREEFAQEVGAESLSVRQLEEAVKARKAAEADLAQAKEQLRDLHADNVTALNAADIQRRRAEALEKRLDYAINHAEVVKEEVVPADYEALKTRDASAAARIREAEDYADAQEERVRALQAELDAARSGQGPQRDDIQTLVSACSTFYGEVSWYQNMTDGELLGGKSRADLMTMRNWVSLIRGWTDTMMVRLGSQPQMEVDGDVR